MYTTILWATDGSPESDGALGTALELLSPGGTLLAFHCDQRFTGGRSGGAPVIVDEPDRLRHIERQVKELEADGVEAKLLVETTHRMTSHEIADVAGRTGAEAIVCGTRGLRGVRGFLSGSIAGELLRRATVPVIVVPAGVSTRAARRHVSTNAAFIG